VDLRAVALHPARPGPQAAGRSDLREAEQRPERDGRVGVRLADLERDVVERRLLPGRIAGAEGDLGQLGAQAVEQLVHALWPTRTWLVSGTGFASATIACSSSAS
jgi:hypothetical protein